MKVSKYDEILRGIAGKVLFVPVGLGVEMLGKFVCFRYVLRTIGFAHAELFAHAAERELAAKVL